MSRYRLLPTPAQEAILGAHCGHARYVWNLAVEQHAHWRPGRAGAPGYVQQCRQFTEARAEHAWLAAGSQMVQQFRVVAVRPGHVRRLSRKTSQVWVPKAGWVRFRAPGNEQVVGIDRGVAVAAALSTGELLHVVGLTARERTRMRRLERKLALEEKAPGRVERIKPAFTSQRCSACGQVDGKSRESQAVFQCTACGYACHADVNAARNIAAGHAVTARGGNGITRPVNREPQLLLHSE